MLSAAGALYITQTGAVAAVKLAFMVRLKSKLPAPPVAPPAVRNPTNYIGTIMHTKEPALINRSVSSTMPVGASASKRKKHLTVT